MEKENPIAIYPNGHKYGIIRIINRQSNDRSQTPKPMFMHSENLPETYKESPKEDHKNWKQRNKRISCSTISSINFQT